MRRRDFVRAACAVLPVSAWARPARALAQPSPERRAVIVDADTANEIDDLWAIVRLVLAPELDVRALSSAQWSHELAPDDSVLASQRLNEDLLELLGRRDIPAPVGSERKLGMPWGGREPRPSPAAHFIVREARRHSPERKLAVVSLGASTNLASALGMAPEIAPSVDAYCLGARYDRATGVWNKDEFNIRRDLNAFNFLCDLEGLSLSVMPVNILFDFKADRDAMVARLAGRGGVWDYLAARWLSNAPGDATRIFWDLALAIALVRPELAEGGLFGTPPENRRREIFVYTGIDEDAMWADWWRIAESAG